MSVGRWRVNRSWTLFLDRDGVLNRRIYGGYVRSWTQFEVLPGVREALSYLSSLFGTVVVVTNQRGIARGLMSERDLDTIHTSMVGTFRTTGGRIDGVYHCPHDKHECACRKPGVGLARRARADFPAIDFNKSVMVGDSASDMQFAARAGLKSVWVGDDRDDPSATAHARLPTLYEFSRWLAAG